MNILFVNACPREGSRTLALARHVMKDIEGEVSTLVLANESLVPLCGQTVARRDALAREGKWEDPLFRYARQFAAADHIVIAAPFWDLSFPSLLKIYLEQVTVAGITFRYDSGKPVGLCRAQCLTYVTTAGGPVFEDFGYTYVKALAKGFYGIPETVAYRAEELDMRGITAEKLLQEAKIITLR